MLLPLLWNTGLFFQAPWLQYGLYIWTWKPKYGRAVFNALAQPTQFFFCSLLNRRSGEGAIFWWSHLLIAKIYRSDERLRWTRKIRSWVAFLEPESHHDQNHDNHVYASVYSFWGSKKQTPVLAKLGTFGPQNHEKWSFYALHIWVKTNWWTRISQKTS